MTQGDESYMNMTTSNMDGETSFQARLLSTDKKISIVDPSNSGKRNKSLHKSLQPLENSRFADESKLEPVPEVEDADEGRTVVSSHPDATASRDNSAVLA